MAHAQMIVAKTILSLMVRDMVSARLNVKAARTDFSLFFTTSPYSRLLWKRTGYEYYGFIGKRQIRICG
jgi:hypothetical protein